MDKMSSFILKMNQTIGKATEMRKDEQVAEAVAISISIIKDLMTVFSDNTSDYFESTIVILSNLNNCFSYLQDAEYLAFGLSAVCATRMEMLQKLQDYENYCRIITSAGIVSKIFTNKLKGVDILDHLELARKHRAHIRFSNWTQITRMIYHNEDGNDREKYVKLLPSTFFKALGSIDEEDMTEAYRTAMECKLDSVDEFLYNWEDPKNARLNLKVLNNLQRRLEQPGYDDNKDWAKYIKELVKPSSEKYLRSFLQKIYSSFETIAINPWWLEKCSIMQKQETTYKNKNKSTDLEIMFKCTLSTRMGKIPNEVINTYFFKDAKEDTSKFVSMSKANSLSSNKFYHGRTYSYDPLDDAWRYQPEVIWLVKKLGTVGSSEGFEDTREVFTMNISGDGQVMTHKYQGEKHCMDTYLSDVRRQVITTYYGYAFTKEVGREFGEIRIADRHHAQVFADASCSEIVDFFNYEMVSAGLKDLRIAPQTTSLAHAFTHFTYQASSGSLMIADLRGWRFGIQPGRAKLQCVIISDTVIHSTKDEDGQLFGKMNRGISGFRKFWTRQHRECNPICKKMGLVRPGNYK